MRLVLFGPQGAGKGTQGARLQEKYAVPSIATGDIFRWAIAEGGELGDTVTEYVRAGRLVPNDLTIRVVLERLCADDCKEGFVLDGFPRNEAQAEALDHFLEERGIPLDAAVAIDIPEEVSLSRIFGRRACLRCGRNYSVDSPPADPWTCDTCGGEVVSRADDLDEAAVRQRLKLYHEQTEPLVAYYRDRGVLREIDGTGRPDEVFDRIVAAL
jgi:adenylate kinase